MECPQRRCGSDVNPIHHNEATLTERQTDESLAKYTARMALRASWIVGIMLAALVLLLNLDRNPIPMLEDWRSFGLLAIFGMMPAAFVVTWTTFILGIKAWNARLGPDRRRGWKVAVLPVTVAYTLLVALVGVVVLQLAEPAFPGLALDRFQAAFLAGLVGAALTYGLVSQAMLITSGNLLRLTIILVGVGVYLAVSNADDPLWWTISFSSVGTHRTFTSWVFNTTLVFGGLMILVWLPYFANDLNILVRHGLTTPEKAKWVNRGLIALGIAIGLVGVFENKVSQVTDMIHNLSAPMMGVIVIIMALDLRRLIPGFPPEVYATSFFLGGTLVLGVIFVMIGYFNTAGITIYGAAIAFTWLLIFVGAVEQTARELRPNAFPN
jgi:hypothetical protein